MDNNHRSDLPGIGSLYIGNLHPDVTESSLFPMFSSAGSLISIRVCRDRATQKSLGYAYVNFGTKEDAERAMQATNYTVLNDRPIRVMWCQRDASSRQLAAANVFVKNLDSQTDNYSLYNIFSAYGTVLSSQVATDANNASKGYGFVQFDNDKSASVAIDKLDGMLVNGKKITVMPFVPRTNRKSEFTNVYVKNLPSNMDDESLLRLFSSYGKIKSSKVMRDDWGKSKGFGFVNYETPEEATAAVAALNGSWFDGKCLYLGKAERKAERERYLGRRRQRGASEGNEFRSVFVKYLSKKVDDIALKQMFKEVGVVTTAKVMRNDENESLGYGFVSFLLPADAMKAIESKNGQSVDGLILYVSRALDKNERISLQRNIYN